MHNCTCLVIGVVPVITINLLEHIQANLFCSLSFQHLRAVSYCVQLLPAFDCSLFSLADSGWSVENVTTEKVTVSGGQSTVRCSSSHLTSFAVLVDVRGVRVNIESP